MSTVTFFTKRLQLSLSFRLFPVKLCPICLGVIAKGKNHNCMPSQRHENVNNFLNNNGPSNAKQIAAAGVLKEMSSNI